MSLDLLEATAVGALNDLAKARGIELDAAALVSLARQWVMAGVALVDGHAKRDAARAGAERAARVTDMESAEQAAKERDP